MDTPYGSQPSLCTQKGSISAIDHIMVNFLSPQCYILSGAG